MKRPYFKVYALSQHGVVVECIRCYTLSKAYNIVYGILALGLKARVFNVLQKQV